jgi:hypothetical protein
MFRNTIAVRENIKLTSNAVNVRKLPALSIPTAERVGVGKAASRTVLLHSPPARMRVRNVAALVMVFQLLTS